MSQEILYKPALLTNNHKFLVSEAIALKMHYETGQIYLDTQLFTGFMFVGATICALLLRSWKTLKVENDALEKQRRETPVTIGAVSEGQQAPADAKARMRAIGKAFVVWRQV